MNIIEIFDINVHWIWSPLFSVFDLMDGFAYSKGMIKTGVTISQIFQWIVDVCSEK